MPALARPCVFVGIGAFGLDVIPHVIGFLQDAEPELLPLVRARGFGFEQAAGLQTMVVTGGFGPDDDLVLEYRRWADDLGSCGDDAALEKIVHGVRASYDQIAGQAVPTNWPWQVEVGRPRVVLVCAAHEPRCARMLEQGLVRNIAKGLFGEQVPNSGIVTVLVADPQSRSSQEDSYSTRWLNTIASSDLPETVTFLVSRHGMNLADTPPTVTPLWFGTQHGDDVEPWSSDYVAGAVYFSRTVLLLMLRAGEADPNDGVNGQVFSTLTRRGVAGGLGLGLVIEPRVEVGQYAVARHLGRLLDDFLEGPYSVRADAASTAVREDEPSPRRKAADGEGRSLFDVSAETAGRGPARDLEDPNYHRDLVGYFVDDVLDPSDLRALPDTAVSNQLNRGLTFEAFGISTVRWWTGAYLPLRPEVLLKRLRRKCLEVMQAAALWSRHVSGVFGAAEGVKKRFDDKLRTRFSDQEDDVDLLIGRVVSARGVTGVLEVFQGIRRAIRTEESTPHRFELPGPIPEDLNEDLVRKIHDLLWKTRVRESPRPLSAAFYTAVASIVLGFGTAYAVKGFYVDSPNYELIAALAFAVGPVVGLIAHFRFLLNEHRRRLKLNEELEVLHQRLVRMVRDQMEARAEAIVKNYMALYRARALRSLTRLVDGVVQRFTAYRQIVRDRRLDLGARAAALEQLPQYRASWARSLVSETDYRALLRRAAEESAPSVRPFRIPPSGSGEEMEPFRAYLANIQLEMSKEIRERTREVFDRHAGLMTDPQQCVEDVLGRANIPNPGVHFTPAESGRALLLAPPEAATTRQIADEFVAGEWGIRGLWLVAKSWAVDPSKVDGNVG